MKIKKIIPELVFDDDCESCKEKDKRIRELDSWLTAANKDQERLCKRIKELEARLAAVER